MISARVARSNCSRNWQPSLTHLKVMILAGGKPANGTICSRCFTRYAPALHRGTRWARPSQRPRLFRRSCGAYLSDTQDTTASPVSHLVLSEEADGFVIRRRQLDRPPVTNLISHVLLQDRIVFSLGPQLLPPSQKQLSQLASSYPQLVSWVVPVLVLVHNFTPGFPPRRAFFSEDGHAGSGMMLTSRRMQPSTILLPSRVMMTVES